jgi:hypothetical protein
VQNGLRLLNMLAFVLYENVTEDIFRNGEDIDIRKMLTLKASLPMGLISLTTFCHLTSTADGTPINIVRRSVCCALLFVAFCQPFIRRIIHAPACPWMGFRSIAAGKAPGLLTVERGERWRAL